MFVGIHHTAISTPDLDRLVAFYQQCFDFQIEFDYPWDESNEDFKKTHAMPETRGRVVMIACGSHRLEIFEYAKPTPRPDIENRNNADLGITHFCFEVKGIEAERERLAAAGMTFQCEIIEQNGAIKNFYGRDPDGNLIEVIEYL